MILAAASPVRAMLPARRSFLAATAASSGLLVLYLGIISLAQGPAHAVEQLVADAPFVVAIALGFGIQVGLFVELRSLNRSHRAGAAVTAAGMGTSTAAMLACCAHHEIHWRSRAGGPRRFTSVRGRPCRRSPLHGHHPRHGTPPRRDG